MQQLGKVLTQTTWDGASNTINNNSDKIYEAITQIENATVKHKGYFQTLSDLKAAYPTPPSGVAAYVYNSANNSSTPYDIYQSDYDDETGTWIWRDTGANASAPIGMGSIESEITRLDNEILQNSNNIEEIRTDIEDLPSIRNSVDTLVSQSPEYYTESNGNATINATNGVYAYANGGKASLTINGVNSNIDLYTNNASVAVRQNDVYIKAYNFFEVFGGLRLRSYYGSVLVNDVASAITGAQRDINRLNTTITEIQNNVITNTDDIGTLDNAIVVEVDRAKDAEEALRSELSSKQRVLRGYSELTDLDNKVQTIGIHNDRGTYGGQVTIQDERVLVTAHQDADGVTAFSQSMLLVMPTQAEMTTQTTDGGSTLTMDGGDAQMMASGSMLIEGNQVDIRNSQGATSNKLSVNGESAYISSKDVNLTQEEGFVEATASGVSIGVKDASQEEYGLIVNKEASRFTTNKVELPQTISVGDDIPDLVSYIEQKTPPVDEINANIDNARELSEYLGQLASNHNASITVDKSNSGWTSVSTFIPYEATVSLSITPDNSVWGIDCRVIYIDGTYETARFDSMKVVQFSAQKDIVRIEAQVDAGLSTQKLTFDVSYVTETDNLTEQVLANTKDITDLKEKSKEIDENTESIAALQGEIAKQKTELDTKITSNTNAIEGFRSEQAQANTNLSERISNNASSISSIEKSMDKRLDIVESQTATNSQNILSLNSTLDRGLSAVNSRVDELNAELDETQGTVEDLRSNLYPTTISTALMEQMQAEGTWENYLKSHNLIYVYE